MGINDDPWALALLDDGTMEGFPSAWDYHESIDELKLKIILELESLHSMREEWRIKEEEMRRKDMEIQRMEAEMKRKDVVMQRMEEELKRKDVELLTKEEENYQLSQLLKITTQERDVARDELQMLLNKFAQLPNAFNLYSITPLPLKTESPQEMKMTRGDSSITDPDSPSETHTNLHSFASSPKLSNINMAKYDRGSWIIDCLATQRALPERGKLLQAVQAVTRAAPLLETLLMTGSLPEWRNPPPSLPFHIPTATTVNGRANHPFNLVL